MNLYLPPQLLPKVRSKAITDGAQGMPCALRFPGICTHDTAKTVWCHLPGIGKSMTSKVSDPHGAFGCHACHDAIDMRQMGLPVAVRLDAMLRAICESQVRLVMAGIIVVPDGRMTK